MKLDDLSDETHCDWCGAGFVAGRVTQRFCCREHRVKAEIARQVAELRAEAAVRNAGCLCPVCGVGFDAGNGNQKYCSYKCTSAAANNRRRGGLTSREAIAALRCLDCGGAITEAKNTLKLRCTPCDKAAKHRQHLEASRRYKAKAKARRNGDSVVTLGKSIGADTLLSP